MKDKESSETSVPKVPHRIPWWVSVLLAIGSYCTLKYLVPELPLTNPALQKLSQAGPTFAPLVTIPFLLLAAKQLYDTDIGEKEHDKPDNGDQKKPEE